MVSRQPYIAKASLSWPDHFFLQGIYLLQYKCPARILRYTVHITDIHIEMSHKMIILLEYIDHYLRSRRVNLTAEDSKPDCNILPIMLALCVMLSGTYHPKIMLA